MSGAIALIKRLRGAGVALRQEGTRLLVEAPVGVITPEVRRHLVRLKQPVLEALTKEAAADDCDGRNADAVYEVSALLAIAYRRCFANKPVGRGSGDAGLANSSESSVHGVVP